MGSDNKAALALLLAIIALNALFAAFVRGPLHERLISIEGRLGGLERLEAGRAGMPHERKGAALGDVLKAARDNGLEIQEAEYNGAAGRGHDAHVMSFPVKGSYGQIKRFIFSLETMGRGVRVDEIILAGGGGVLSARLGLYMAKARGL